jgi:hypothetical protein
MAFDEDMLLVIRRSNDGPGDGYAVRPLSWGTEYLAVFGELTNLPVTESHVKWHVSLTISALLDDPTVLIEGVLFRARYLGSTQLACEGQPTKSTRMCQAEEAVSRIKVLKPQTASNLSFHVSYF